MIQQAIVCTAGHVDHGKSSLVRALTGTDPDRLPEEKARGITIDLGFARLELPYPDGEDTVEVGLVDVPGHEDFVKNMVAGVGAADLALIVVAADDGWMPQTEEHVQILGYLGVPRAVVALTKADRVGDLDLALAAVGARLAGTAYASAPIVATSVVTGAGLQELRRVLAQELSRAPAGERSGLPRLWIDRTFSVRGIGVVVTGTLQGGPLRVGQEVVVQPGGIATRIRGLQRHHRPCEEAPPGSRTALNLADVQLADPAAPVARTVRRGQLLAAPELGPGHDTLDVWIERSPRAIPGAGECLLRHGARVWMHLGTAKLAARVALADLESVATGGRALAQLRLAGPVPALRADRLILRDWSERSTLAGATVLDPRARRGRLRSAAQREFLRRNLEHLHDPAGALEALLARDGAIAAQGPWPGGNFSEQELRRARAHLVAAGRAVEAGGWLVRRPSWEAARDQALKAVGDWHAAHPERAGLPVLRLEAELAGALPQPGLFAALLDELVAGPCVRDETLVRLRTHRPALPAHLRAAGAALRSSLSAQPLLPPSRTELAPDRLKQEALRYLLTTGQGVEIGSEVVLLAENYRRAKERIREFLETRASATVSEIRQELGTSRRIIVPLLERLDKEGFTRRVGDKRVLRRSGGRG